MKVFRALLLLVLLSPSMSAAQAVYKWKDEQGNWHYSQTPPPGVNPQLMETWPQREPGERKPEGGNRAKLGRSYAGLSLGERLGSFVSARRVMERGTDASGVRVFAVVEELLPAGTVDLAAGFSHGRLVSITVKFSGQHVSSLGGWEGLVQETTGKYGPPAKAQSGWALWRDDETGLVLARGGDGTVSATFGSLPFVVPSSDLEKAPANPGSER